MVVSETLLTLGIACTLSSYSQVCSGNKNSGRLILSSESEARIGKKVKTFINRPALAKQ